MRLRCDLHRKLACGLTLSPRPPTTISSYFSSSCGRVNHSRAERLDTIPKALVIGMTSSESLKHAQHSRAIVATIFTASFSIVHTKTAVATCRKDDDWVDS